MSVCVFVSLCFKSSRVDLLRFDVGLRAKAIVWCFTSWSFLELKFVFTTRARAHLKLVKRLNVLSGKASSNKHLDGQQAKRVLLGVLPEVC